jgi:hypothetical protein
MMQRDFAVRGMSVERRDPAIALIGPFSTARETKPRLRQ